jgi:hypothetical protein
MAHRTRCEQRQSQHLASRRARSGSPSRREPAFTTQSGKLFLIGLNRPGRLDLRAHVQPLHGLAACGRADEQPLSYGSSRTPDARGRHDGYDKLYVPNGYTKGGVDNHDVAVDADGRVVFVNTLLSCLATVSETHSFEALWKPRFVSKLAAEDRCHLNGLALRDGRPAFVTAVSRSDVADGWRDRRRDGGVLIDVDSNEVLAEGFSMPHSPRWRDGVLYLLDSGRGVFGKLDLATCKLEEIAFCPGMRRPRIRRRLRRDRLSRPRATPRPPGRCAAPRRRPRAPQRGAARRAHRRRSAQRRRGALLKLGGVVAALRCRKATA